VIVSADVSLFGGKYDLPAFVIKMSSLSLFFLNSAAAERTLFKLAKSITTKSAATPSPSLEMSATAACPFSSLRAVMKILAPVERRDLAVSRPSPPVPPVTSTTLPSKLPSAFKSLITSAAVGR
jgi:hypothetical protein